MTDSLYFKNLMKADSVRKNIRIVFSNEDIHDLNNSDIVQNSFSFTESVSSSKNFKFGGGEASVLNFTAINIPNVINEEITVYIDYFSDVPDEDNYSVFLGKFIIYECKKESTDSNIRKISAMTKNELSSTMIAELNAARNYAEQYRRDKVVTVNMREFLTAGDEHIKNNEYYLAMELRESLFWTGNVTAGIIKFENVYYDVRFNLEVNQYEHRLNYFEHNVDYNSDYRKEDIESRLSDMLPFFVPSSDKKRVLTPIFEMLDEAQNRFAVNKLMYHLNDAYTLRTYFPFHKLKIEVYNETTRETQESIFNFSPAIQWYPVFYESIPNSEITMVPLPEKGKENDWFKKLRQSWYELIGYFGKARYNYRPELIYSGNLLFPAEDLYPSDDLYPGGSSETLTSNLIKKLWTDEKGVKYGSVEFHWISDGEEQTFTWNIPKNYSDLGNYEEFIPDHEIQETTKELNIVFKSPLVSPLLYLTLWNTSDDYIIEIIKTTASGLKVEKLGILSTLNISGNTDGSTSMEDSQFNVGGGNGGKCFNDALVGATSLKIRKKDGSDIDNIQVNEIYIYVLSEDIEYLDGDTYVIDDNYILNNCYMDSFKIPFFVKQLDEQLRTINYVPVDMELKGLPDLEAGTGIEILTRNDSINTLVLRRTLKGDASLNDSFETY